MTSTSAQFAIKGDMMTKIFISVGWFFINLYGWAYVLHNTDSRSWIIFPLSLTSVIFMLFSLAIFILSVIEYEEKH